MGDSKPKRTYQVKFSCNISVKFYLKFAYEWIENVINLKFHCFKDFDVSDALKKLLHIFTQNGLETTTTDDFSLEVGFVIKLSFRILNWVCPC